MFAMFPGGETCHSGFPQVELVKPFNKALKEKQANEGNIKPQKP